MAETGTIGAALPRTVDGRPVIAAIVNNMVAPLSAPLVGTPEVEPLTRADAYGIDVYRATLFFLLAACAAKLSPGSLFRVRHSLGSSFYCSWDGDVSALKRAVTELVAENAPIVVEFVPYGEAVELFRADGRHDELNLLRHRNPPVVTISRCGAFRALHQQVLAPSSGVADYWDLLPAPGGLVLQLPSNSEPDVLPDLTEMLADSRYLEIFRNHLSRAKITGVETVGDLNQIILEKRFDEYVRVVETQQRRSLAAIADSIVARRPAVRLVLVAGPSSAGKTTTAVLLCTQLRACGLKARLVSTDDYFVGDARNPRDADGKLDYETVEAVDRDRLAADLNALFAGESVHLRKFDFRRHDGYDDSAETVLEPDGVIVLEGIHALNPSLTDGIADALKFRVYLNALTQLVVDSCNRISTTDTRLIRRLVRDFSYRGMSPLDTFRLWPNVAAGERKWIYPYQRHADAVFNSALDYELAVLKPFVLQLLNQVKPWHREYLEARRLSGILHNVSLASPDAVPGDSVLRESIGGSQLAY
jgi:uridine kinase